MIRPEAPAVRCIICKTNLKLVTPLVIKINGTFGAVDFEGDVIIPSPCVPGSFDASESAVFAFDHKHELVVHIPQAGKYVICEKPKKFIDEGAVGEILNVRCTYLQSWSADPDSPLSWRFQKDIAGAGTLGDIASHVIDIAQYLAGDIDEVVSMVKTYIKERPVQEGGVDLLGTVKLGAEAPRKEVDVDDEDAFLVKFKSGAVGSIEATRNAWGRNNFITVDLLLTAWHSPALSGYLSDFSARDFPSRTAPW